jgi:hypothetical protein
MPRLLPFCLLAGWVIRTALAGPTEDALVAAMRLSEKPNYTWNATVTDDARSYDIAGQIGPEGFSRVRMPAINTVRRRLGRSVTDTEVEFIFRGNVACVVATDQGWLRPEELPPPPENEKKGNASRRGATGDTKSVSVRSGGVDLGPPGLNVPLPGEAENRPRGYSNLQPGLSLPHEELGIIVSSHTEFKVEGDIVTGALTELGAQLLLVRDGRPEIVPRQATGTFKLWLRDGLVTRYQVRLSGQLQIVTPGGRQQVAVNQHTDTVLKNVGATRFEVPEEARRKLTP